MSMRELNEKLSIISRVVVHPKYRTIGLGAKLVRETLSFAGTPYVEMPAVMAKYNPFAEKAGMQEIVVQPPPQEALRVAALLEKIGFNKQMLCSRTCVFSKLKVLSEIDVTKIKEVSIKNNHTCFLKAFAYHQPFGTKTAYAEAVAEIDLDKLADLIRVCGFLTQTKSYLFWKA